MQEREGLREEEGRNREKDSWKDGFDGGNEGIEIHGKRKVWSE